MAAGEKKKRLGVNLVAVFLFYFLLFCIWEAYRCCCYFLPTITTITRNYPLIHVWGESVFATGDIRIQSGLRLARTG